MAAATKKSAEKRNLLAPESAIKLLFARARRRYAKLIDTYGGSRADFTQVPYHTVRTPIGGFQWARGQGSWRSGFFPGVLWYLHALTGDSTFGRSAASFTEALSPKDKWWQHTHDVGFVFGCSYGNGLRFGTDVGINATLYSSELEAAAAKLAQRFSRGVGMTRSWGSSSSFQFTVIIDNMMNLELMYWVANRTSNSTLAEMADSHARKTAAIWIRPDGSTSHVCHFVAASGVLRICTAHGQGWLANTTWARGHSWGLYGFTMAYRYRRHSWLLATAQRLADYYLLVAPPGLVAYWDHQLAPPFLQEWKDTSSSAIAASAFLELSSHSVGAARRRYHDAAHQILASFVSEPGLLANASSQALLASNMHDCGAVECTMMESEYYLMEALYRSQREFQQFPRRTSSSYKGRNSDA